MTLGNPQGDVTVVEFFDYNCGYCKRAMSDMLDLLKSDAQAQVRAQGIPGARRRLGTRRRRSRSAVRMQDKPAARNISNSTRSCSAGAARPTRRARSRSAKEVGLDMARIEKDMASDEVKATLEESFKLAEALGLNGTPSYVVGNDVVVGAVGLDALKEKVNAARCGKPTCWRSGRCPRSNGRQAAAAATSCEPRSAPTQDGVRVSRPMRRRARSASPLYARSL